MNDLLDRMAVQEVLDRYFAAIDRCDPELVRTCFADEAVYRSDAGLLDMDSGDEIGRRLAQGGRFVATSHLKSSQLLIVAGDEASADTFALAYLVEDVSEGGRVHVRGLRYRDRLVRCGGEWKIVHRHHSTQWQVAQTCAEAMPV